jgi:hypothetical protein
MKKTVLLFIVAPLFVTAQNKDSIALKYAGSLSIESLKNNLTIIASDEYEGRETGRRGQKMAADFIAREFKAAGVEPLKHNNYFQQFLLDEKQPGEIKIFIEEKEYKANADYYSFSSDINTNKRKIKTKEITFLGYGIEDKNYNDYINADIKNKTLLILSGEPMDKDSLPLIKDQKEWVGFDKLKIKSAKEKGVRTLLIVKEEIEKDIERYKNKLQSPGMILKNEKDRIVVIYISKQMANELLVGVTSIDKLKQQITALQSPVTVKISKRLKIETKSKAQQIGSENVLGYIEGSDLKEEVIVISAHYDHLGIKDNKVYNGADDDGSGTVALIELSKAFAKAKKEGKGPRRSMLFIAFSGEEKGLLGSLYYAEHPEIAMNKTVCDLNMDMIGRIDEKHTNQPDYVYVIGSDKLSSELHAISETANKTYTHLELDYTYNDEKDKNRFYYRSDHYNFAKNGVPVIFYFNGVHEDYHQETDEVQKINFEKIKDRSTLVFFTAWELANRNERIKVDSNKK